jgi:PPOX class probable F420-dependent enzyme
MTRDEIRSFLLEGTRTGKLATTRADGRPHVTPVWFVLDVPPLSPSQGSGSAFWSPSQGSGSGATTAQPPSPRATDGRAAVADELMLTTGAASLKAKAIRRDGRVCLCVDDQVPPYSYVMIEGTAVLSDDVDELRRWATAIGGRYMGADRADEFGARNAVPEELLVRITPTHVVAWADMAD